MRHLGVIVALSLALAGTCAASDGDLVALANTIYGSAKFSSVADVPSDLRDVLNTGMTAAVLTKLASNVTLTDSDLSNGVTPTAVLNIPNWLLPASPALANVIEANGVGRLNIPVVAKVASILLPAGQPARNALFTRLTSVSADNDVYRAVGRVVLGSSGLENLTPDQMAIFAMEPKTLVLQRTESIEKLVAAVTSNNAAVNSQQLVAILKQYSSWAKVDEATRTGWFKFMKATVGMSAFTDASSAGLYPLLVGASLAELGTLASVDPKLLETGAASMHPAQMQVLMRMVDWTSPAVLLERSLVRKFLALADVSAQMDVDPLVFNQDNFPYSLILKIANVGNKYPVSSASFDQFMALNTSSQINQFFLTYKDDFTMSNLTSVLSKRMTYGQVLAVLTEYTVKSKVQKLNELPIESYRTFPATWLMGVDVGNVNGGYGTLYSMFQYMMHSQRTAVFFKSINFKQGRNLTAVQQNFIKDPSQVLSFVQPAEIRSNLDQFTGFTLGGSSTASGSSMVDDSIFAVATQMPMSSRMAWMEQARKAWSQANPLPPASSPISIAADWFPFNMTFTSANPSVIFGLSGLTCHDIIHTNPMGITQLLAMYNHARDTRATATTFTLSVRNCLRDKLVTYLNIRKSMSSSDVTSSLGMLTDAEICSAGGHVLSAFTSDDLSKVDAGLAKSITRQMGRLSMPEFITLITKDKLKSIGDLALSIRNNASLSAADLLEMGTIAAFMPKVLSSATPAAVKAFVVGHMSGKYQRSVCLSADDRALWSAALQNAFGPIDSWDAEALYQMGDLLVALDDASKAKIAPAALMAAVPYLLQTSNFNENYDSTQIYTNNTKIYKVCSDWLQDGGDFAQAYTSLMRLYLQGAQLGVNVALAGTPLSRARRSLSDDQEPSFDFDLFKENLAYFRVESRDFNTNLRKRRRRQAVQTISPATQLNFFLTRTQQLLVTRIQNSTSDVQAAAVAVLADSKNQSNAFLSTFGLTAPNADVAGFITAAFNNGTINAATFNSINQFQLAQQSNITLIMQRILNFVPADFNVTQADFCAFFTNATLCVNGSAPTTATPVATTPPATTATPVTTTAPSTNVLPTTFTCHGVIAAGQAAVALDSTDLATWDAATLYSCLEPFGSIDWPLATKRKVWATLVSKKAGINFGNSSSALKVGDLILMNKLVSAVAVDNPSNLPISIDVMETISAVGELPIDDPAILSTLVNIIKNTATSKNESLPLADNGLNMMVFGAMKHLVCGFLDEDLTPIFGTPSVASNLLPIMGTLKACPNPSALAIMANSALNLYGGVTNMQPSDISSLGIVVAGFNGSTLAAMSSKQLSAVSVLASHGLTSSQLTSLSTEQVGNLSMDALAPLLRSGLITETVKTQLNIVADDRAMVEIEVPAQSQDRLVGSKSGAMQTLQSLTVMISSIVFVMLTRWMV